jgi:hypothetical protein
MYSVADLLAETAADFLGNTFCDGHGSDKTRLCATYSTFVYVPVLGKILYYLSCLARPGVSNNYKDLVLPQIILSDWSREDWGQTYISDGLQQWSA